MIDDVDDDDGDDEDEDEHDNDDDDDDADYDDGDHDDDDTALHSMLTSPSPAENGKIIGSPGRRGCGEIIPNEPHCFAVNVQTNEARFNHYYPPPTRSWTE